MENFANLSSKIKNLIENSTRILLCLHPSPDGDSVGSSLALFLYLKNIGKNVTLIKGDSELPPSLLTLPSSEDITLQNFFEVDLKSFDLLITPDISSPNQISKIAEMSFPKNLKIVVIDHHQSNLNFGHLNLVDTNSPATCQIVYQLLENWKAKITESMATNLIVGIYTDTGGFKYPKTTSLTFKIVADLVKISPNYTDYIFNLENNSTPGHVKFKGLALSSIKLFYQGKLAVSAISLKALQKSKLSRTDAEKSDISNTLKSVIGWDIGATLVEIEPRVCTLSLRTRNSTKYDLSKIGLATGSGGGHPAAAGGTIYQPFNQAIKTLVKIIGQLHPEMGKA